MILALTDTNCAPFFTFPREASEYAERDMLGPETDARSGSCSDSGRPRDPRGPEEAGK